MNRTVVTVAIVLVAIGVGVGVLQAIAASIGESNYITESEDWCERHNGTLSSHNVVGKHGGLHCTLPDGTGVHMDTVARLNYTDNVSKVQTQFKKEPGFFESAAVVLGIALVIVLAISFGRRLFAGDDRERNT